VRPHAAQRDGLDRHEPGQRLDHPATADEAIRAASAERRLESCWFGTGFRTKVRAWNEAVGIARARGLTIA